MPYIPYTDEQKQLANNVDLPTFLRMRGEKLVPVGREFKLIYHDGYGKHDSITISGSQWYDHKNQIGGGPIKFMQEHYGMNFQEAMQALLGHSALPLTHEVQPVMAKEKKEFRLPEANDNMHRVYAYLIKQRFIAPEVITHFAKRKLLYEDKKHHNAVFVGVDSSGVPRQAHKRSTTTFGNSFRQTIEGSDTKYSFAHFGKSNMLFVFEAPIDMLSYITLYPNNWKNNSYIAMNGVYESAVLTALEEHPNIDWIVICTDNDEGGIDAAHRLWDILNERGYDLSIYPPNNKDWNEDLKEEHGVPFIPAVPHKTWEEYERQAESLQYYPCRIEKLRSQLNAAFRNGQYRYLAEYALAGSVFFSQKAGSDQDSDRAFRSSVERLAAFYRPYRDRSRTISLRRELGEKVADVMQDLKCYARTEEQTRATADKLYDLADYADEGITGTREDKRDEFQRLMKDCRRGKIDRIYTKSISRFARNTKDCLKNLRELKSLGISVFLEKENIDTANMTDEIMITILGGLAQEESVSISQNMRWSVRKRMENGTIKMSSRPFGFRLHQGQLIVHDEEAEVVKQIFNWYLSGYGITLIAQTLNQMKVQKFGRKCHWTPETVAKILRNEKYIGDQLFQKYYTSDTLPFRELPNRGEHPQFYYKDRNEAIISREEYESVQILLHQNREYGLHDAYHHPLSKHIYCSECEASFKRKRKRNGFYWTCRRHDKEPDLCSMKPIDEKLIISAFMLLHNKLLHHYRSILLPLQQMLQELKCRKYGGNVRVMDVHKEIAKLREQNHVIARLRTKGFMDEGKFQEQSKELGNKIRKLQAELKKITRSDDEDDVLEQLDMLIDYFEKRDKMMVSFEPETFDMMVDRITANQNELTFHLLGGIELKEKI